MKKKMYGLILLAFLFLISATVPVKAAAVSKPVVITKTITDETINIRVLGYKGTTLYVKNGKKTVKKQAYSSDGVKVIKIKAQKNGSTLQFQLKKGKNQSSIVKVKVKKLASQKKAASVKKPTISTKTIKSNTKSIQVKAVKGSTLKIVNDSKKVIKSVKYTKTASKKITIPKQTATDTLYFYCIKGSKRSTVVKKSVKDVTAPTKPKVTEKSSSSLLVKGEVGSIIYIKYGSSTAYVNKGVITSKNGRTITGLKPNSSGYYSMYLKDASGNKSSVMNLKSKYYKPGTNTGDNNNNNSNNNNSNNGNNNNTQNDNTNATEYSYTITPLLAPFNEYFYVKTDNPDPSKIRFVDKNSVYYKSGEEPDYIEPVKYRFLDVTYENKTTGRVKGGYIFSSYNREVDGGSLILQTSSGTSSYKDTKIQVSCANVKSYIQYLIDTYTSSSKTFFENLDAVQSGLDSLALYPRGTKDINKKNSKFPYPMLTVSLYPEHSLNEWYQMYENSEEPLFLNYLYPYILDSLGVPSTIANVAKKLDSSCTVERGDYHYLITVTKGSETKTYGGAGAGTSDPIYSNRVEKLFLFDGSSMDYAYNATLSKLSAKRCEYGKYAEADAEKYRDLIQGDTFSKTVGLGSWIRVGTEGFDLSNKSYAYVTHGCIYTEGSTEGAYSVENVWVDGRYINQNNCFEKGATFSKYPKADIMIRNMTYTNKWGKTCRGDVTYEYDEKSGCWLSRAYVSTSSNSWLSYTIDDLPDEMILTPTEVANLKVDRNTNTIPSGLIYDGSAAPGTPY